MTAQFFFNFFYVIRNAVILFSSGPKNSESVIFSD